MEKWKFLTIFCSNPTPNRPPASCVCAKDEDERASNRANIAKAFFFIHKTNYWFVLVKSLYFTIWSMVLGMSKIGS